MVTRTRVAFGAESAAFPSEGLESRLVDPHVATPCLTTLPDFVWVPRPPSRRPNAPPALGGDRQRHVVQPPRTLMRYGTSHRVGSVIRPVFSVAGRNRPGHSQP